MVVHDRIALKKAIWGPEALTEASDESVTLMLGSALIFVL